MTTNSMKIEAEAFRHSKKEIEVLLNVVEAYKQEQIRLVSEIKRYNKKAGGTQDDFEMIKKRLLADINHIKTQGTIKLLFSKSKDSQTQTNLTGVDK